MGVYEPKTILLPSGIDEIALERSAVRLPEESLEDFKRRLILEHRDPVSNSFSSFKKSPTRQVGALEIPIARISLDANLSGPAPRLKVTASKLYFYADADDDPVLECDLQNRNGQYFLTDVITMLSSLPQLVVEILDADYAYRFSRQLRVDDTDVVDSQILAENYVNRLEHGLVRDLTFTDSLVFKTPISSAAALAETGDFYIDIENGVVFSNDLQHGYVSYTYSNFPFILWWQPVRTFELNDPDIDFMIKSNVNVDDGKERKILNARGTAYVNELLEVHPLEWGA
jgi:hypothetical protein